MITIDDVQIYNGIIICKGVRLSITQENIQDYVSQTGMDGIMLVEWAYNNDISVIRDRKLQELLS